MTLSLARPSEPGVELSVVIPCLNEAATIGICVEKALAFLGGADVCGEVVVADNGSTDGSIEIVEASGARLVRVAHRGYGSALRAGVQAAQGRYVIMGDGDDSYDFSALQPFLDELREGTELVVGNRFQGGIEPGAMPLLNRYVGNPVLSFLGRRLFNIRIGDFHCGLRGCDREAIEALELMTSGMEFASEMIVRAQLSGLRIAEVPTTLSRDGRPGGSHLRALPDGLRHLLFLFLYCPRWLFFVPGGILIFFGLLAGVPTAFGPVGLGPVKFDVDTLAVGAAALIIGIQAVQFGLLANLYGVRMRLFPNRATASRMLGAVSFSRVLPVAGLLISAGVAGVIFATVEWQQARFGVLNTRHEVRLIIPAITALVVGFQLLLGRLFMGLLGAEFAEGPLP